MFSTDSIRLQMTLLQASSRYRDSGSGLNDRRFQVEVLASPTRPTKGNIELGRSPLTYDSRQTSLKNTTTHARHDRYETIMRDCQASRVGLVRRRSLYQGLFRCLASACLLVYALALVEDGEISIAICRLYGSTARVCWAGFCVIGELIYTAESALQRRARARLGILAPTEKEARVCISKGWSHLSVPLLRSNHTVLVLSLYIRSLSSLFQQATGRF
jgi:hypothetical protein